MPLRFRDRRFRLHLSGVSTSGLLDSDAVKKWWSPLRLQVSSTARIVARSLGEDHALALKLQVLASDIVSYTQCQEASAGPPPS